eukprot:3752909-Amphidinium_carterae.1
MQRHGCTNPSGSNASRWRLCLRPISPCGSRDKVPLNMEGVLWVGCFQAVMLAVCTLFQMQAA